jgi:hypothetical protein
MAMPYIYHKTAICALYLREVWVLKEYLAALRLNRQMVEGFKNPKKPLNL